MIQGNSITPVNNPLVQAANPLLNAISEIRHLPVQVDPVLLRQKLIEEMRRFEIRGQLASLPHEVIIGARYCLCTALDEAASLTPWGSASVWSSSGLLVTFHNETGGGEKFFQLAAKLSQNPHEHINLLELINFCLLLGFEGRYRVIENGRSQLETVKQRLLQLIRLVRGSYAQPLSPQGFELPVQQTSSHTAMPLLVCLLLVSFLASLLFITLNWQLGNDTNRVLAAIYQTKLPQMTISSSVQATPGKLNLKSFLRQEIVEGLVVVRDEARQSVILLKGDGLFNSAATKVRANYIRVIDRIATAINSVSGNILVVGYSDNLPIHSTHFASNRELSLARAEAVGTQLRRYLDNPQRVKTEGRGESNPVAPNTNDANRALNRRVEIILLAIPERTQVEVNELSQGNGK
ncbi:DotU family type VI secretion system protein [Brucella gallinifaecis]|uniref:DotU family type VI secretion system protein n=1 Tax=Brucella gallinifaecis TaxID=215590 RepID=A0A502BK18_9HYPH|nr:DotU family type VI secretion system protein [Brucella gallinifaecis]TPF74011.1 DotU family type VI secretion system protein [Brucella gallinifaecis]